jgi:hypothetical protein
MTQPFDSDQPRIETRGEQPYAGIRVAVTMAGFPAAADTTFPALIGANAALQDYAKQNGIAFAARDTPAGQAWDGRFEYYLTDPTAEPDAARWQTDVAYLTDGTG